MIDVQLSKDQKKLVITCDVETPKASASGKTQVIASTRGNMQTAAMFAIGKEHKPLVIGLNVYFKP